MKDITHDLTAFSKLSGELIATNDQAWNEYYGWQRVKRTRQYTLQDIDNIVEEGSKEAKRRLSLDFFLKNGFYKRILFYYATLLTYSGILIPNPLNGKKLSEKTLIKRYQNALNYLNKIELQELLTHMSLRALIDGSYYGAILYANKDELVIMDLPMGYALSRFKDYKGNDIVEFNVSYFDTINDTKARNIALKNYPKEVQTYYRKYKDGKTIDSWVRLPSNVGVSFSFSDDGLPIFLSVIPATVQYDQAVDTERERDIEDIRKIIVQHMPHLSDGQLVFEPDEALEMHKGTVNMLKGNKYLSVLTTYADVEAVTSRTTESAHNNVLNSMWLNIYNETGTSAQLFSGDNGQVIKYNIKNDLSLMMILANKYSRFISNILNNLFGNGAIYFKYRIFPFTLYLRSDDITDTFKLAQSGYSLLLPSLAAGLSQSDLVGLKDLENDGLKLNEVLIPPSSSYTSSSNETITVDKEEKPQPATEEGGAPKKEPEELDPETVEKQKTQNQA